jgi:hypothetical protein
LHEARAGNQIRDDVDHSDHWTEQRFDRTTKPEKPVVYCRTRPSAKTAANGTPAAKIGVRTENMGTRATSLKVTSGFGCVAFV